MGSLSDWAEKLVLEHSVGKTVWVVSQVYVRLYTELLDDTKTLDASSTELTSAGYAPVLMAAGDWSAAADGSISNAKEVVFGPAAAQWNTVRAAAITDQNKNIIWWGNLPEEKRVLQNSSLRFQRGDLLLTLS